jgi:short-subunit dehydrogenase
MRFPYSTALVTGASSGIGQAFAEALAARGCDLILVARSADKLRQLAARLALAHGRRVEVIAADLAQLSPGAALKEQADRLGMKVDLLVNNAGFGTKGPFETLDPAREQQEVLLNIGAVVDLSRAFLPAMLEGGRGAIVNLSSMAGFQPTPYMAVYGASKAFVWAFSDALWVETGGRGVHVMAVCPGPVDTAFFDLPGISGLRDSVPKGSALSPQRVVDAALAGLLAKRRLVIPGAMVHAMSWLTRLGPRALLARGAGRVMNR